MAPRKSNPFHDNPPPPPRTINVLAHQKFQGSGSPLLAGDIFQMLGLPSLGSMTTPLEQITNTILGPGTYRNFQNAGTKMLLDKVVKGVVGGKKPKAKKVKHAVVKHCNHKNKARCKCPVACMCKNKHKCMCGGGIFDDLFGKAKEYVSILDPKAIANKGANMVFESMMKKVLSGGSIDSEIEGFGRRVSAQVKHDLRRHIMSGGAMTADHPIFYKGPLIGQSWTKWLNPLYLAKRALHATHIDRIIDKIPVVGSVAKATGVVGSAAPRRRGRPRKHHMLGGAIPDLEQYDAKDLKKLYDIMEVGRLDKDELIARVKPHFEDSASDEAESVHLDNLKSEPKSKAQRQREYRARNRELINQKQREYRESKKVKVI